MENVATVSPGVGARRCAFAPTAGTTSNAATTRNRTSLTSVHTCRYPSFSLQIAESREPPLQSHRLPHRPLAPHVPRVQRPRRLEQQHLHLLVRHRPVLHPARHDEKVPGLERDRAVAHLHAEPPPMHEEQLILVLVMMPHELPPELHELHVLPVELPHDPRTPVL